MVREVGASCSRAYRLVVLEPHLDSVRKEMKVLHKMIGIRSWREERAANERDMGGGR